MTRDEVKKIVRIIVSSFPNWNPKDLADTVDAWTFSLEDYSYGDIAVALKGYIQSNTSGFAPSVGQLIGMVRKADEYSYLNEMEAWAIVDNAIRRAGYYAEEEFAKMPELVQKAIGSPSNLRSMALSEDYNESVVMSNFQRTYRTVVERDKEYRALPQEMKLKIEDMKCKGFLEDGKKEENRESQLISRGL